MRSSSAKRMVVEAPETQPASQQPSPLYGVALLKIALEVKKGTAGLEEAMRRVVTSMQLPEDDFRAYLGQNGGLLRTLKPRTRTP